jgi:hypothetical protein
MVQRMPAPDVPESPYRVDPRRTNLYPPENEQRHVPVQLWEGELYGPADSRHGTTQSERSRVRVVRVFKQVNDGRGGVRAEPCNVVEVSLDRDTLGARVWRPASDFGSSYADPILAAVARAVPG